MAHYDEIKTIYVENKVKLKDMGNKNDTFISSFEERFSEKKKK